MRDNNISDMGAKTTMGVEFKPLEAKSYDYIIHGIVGLGLRPQSYQGKEKEPAAMIKVIFELPGEIRDDGQTQVISYKINLFMSENGFHYRFCKMLLGDRVNDKTIVEFVGASGLKQLLGKTGVLTVKHWEKDGRIIATVDNKGFYPLDPRIPKPVATRPEFFFNPFKPDLEVFKNTLTYYTQKEVMEALNADEFPAELHRAWAEIQENKANEGSNKAKAKVEDVSKEANTSAIE